MCELLAKKANVKFLAICTDCLHLLGYSHTETKIQVRIYIFIFEKLRTNDNFNFFGLLDFLNGKFVFGVKTISLKC